MQAQLAQSLQKIVQKLFQVKVTPELSRPETKFGDYATNVALRLAKTLNQNPREIAEKIAQSLSKESFVATAELAGPGFVNIVLRDESLQEQLDKILIEQTDYGRPDQYHQKTVVVEFSDPNPFKVLHMGHFYTSVVGDAMSNLVEAAGGKVHRVNFGGDTGLHVAKTLWGVLKRLGGELPDRLHDIAEGERIDWISACYVEGNNAYAENDAAKLEIVAINKRVYEITNAKEKTSNFAKIYWTARQWSYDYFDQFYDSIGVKFEKYYPESETARLGLKTVREHPEVYTKSNGAIIFDGEKFGLHTRVFINREGLPTYETKDMGCTLQKYADYHFDQHIIITGNDIIEYMKVVLKSIEQFAPEVAQTTRHYTHGMLKLPGGIKQSSRLGNAIRAVDILTLTAEAQEKEQGSRNQATVLGAIRYAFLKHRLGPDVIFDPATSVSLQGNSGPYLQYSHARARSILRKINSAEQPSVQALDEFERLLVVKLTEWPEILAAAVQELAPHLICSYLYELAQTFNRFYENDRVAGDPRQAFRARLVEAYAIVLQNGLTILGIVAPDQM